MSRDITFQTLDSELQSPDFCVGGVKLTVHHRQLISEPFLFLAWRIWSIPSGGPLAAPTRHPHRSHGRVTFEDHFITNLG